jgi:membrane protease YdiL (CAAX protease family)
MGTLGTVAVLPYVVALTPALQQAAAKLGWPIAALLAISVLQSAVMMLVIAFAGVFAAERLELRAPWLETALLRSPAPAEGTRSAIRALRVGVAIGVVLLVLDVEVFLRVSPESVGVLLRQPQPPAWMGLLASLEGGMTEEIELRLFLLSVLALALRSVGRSAGVARADEPLPAWVFWTANIVAAVLFGLGHLPTTRQLVPLTPPVVVRAVVLNGLLGVVAGQLYRRRGLEMAMLCHFGTDLVLHVAGPVLQPLVFGS